VTAVPIVLFEPDPRRAASISRKLDALRLPVSVVASLEGLAERASGQRDVVVAVSGLGGGIGARVRAVREDARTGALTVAALVPPGPGTVAALRAGADDVLVWPSNEVVVRSRFRGLLAAIRSNEEARTTATAYARILEAVEAKEPHRIEHSARVGRLAAAMARGAGLSAAEVERVRFGGLLHDFGTIAIPDGILYKREPLTDAEFAVMRSHPVVGFSLLKDVHALEPYLPFVLRHHERVDGSGYPDGLRRSEIPVPVQLVSLADSYDAMTSSRPYRAVRDDRQTFQVLEDEAHRGLWEPSHIPLLVASIAELGER
jgi:putative two-component system response regulator